MSLLNADTAVLTAVRDPHEQMREKLARRRLLLDTGSLDAAPTDPVEIDQEADEVQQGRPDAVQVQIYTSQQPAQPEEFPIYTMEKQGLPHDIPIYTFLQQGAAEEFTTYTLPKVEVSCETPAAGQLQVPASESPNSLLAATSCFCTSTCQDDFEIYQPAQLLEQTHGAEEFPIHTLHEAGASCETPPGGQLQVLASESSHGPPTVTFNLSTQTHRDGCDDNQAAKMLKQRDGPEEFPIYTLHEAEETCDTPVDDHLQVPASDDAPPPMTDGSGMKNSEDAFDILQGSLEISNNCRHEANDSCDTHTRCHSQGLASDDGQGSPNNAGMKTCPVVCGVHLSKSEKYQRLVQSRHHGRTKHGSKVKLHIYDVSRIPAISHLNSLLANKDAPVKLGGIFHAAIEVGAVEWSFGSEPADPEVDTGVRQCAPKKDPNHSYRQTVLLGRTNLSEGQIAALIADLKEAYDADDYELMTKNCCHFADDFANRLGVGGLPRWLLRFADLGASVESLLPEPVRELLPW